MDYLHGTDILGAESLTLVAGPDMLSSEGELAILVDEILGAEQYFGPGGAGPVYTDKATITAVQKALEKKGYFHGTVDGKFGPITEAAIFNFSGQHGPPDDAVLLKLGVKPPGAKSVSFSDDEVDSFVVQAKTATTPAQVQIVAAKIENLAPPELKQEAAAAKQAAATATTPEQVTAAKLRVEAVTQKMRPGMATWKIGLIAGGAGVLALSILALVARRPRTAGA